MAAITPRSDSDRKELTDALHVMKCGTPISLYTTTWVGTDFRMFQLSEKNDAVIYSSVTKLGTKGAVSEEKIFLRDITRVHVGQQTELFKGYAQKELEPLCFSIEYMATGGEKAVLDLVCCRRADAQIWTIGLRTLMDNTSVQTVPVHIDDSPDMCALNMMYRSKWKSAARLGISGSAAVLTFGTPLFLVGAPWLAYSMYSTRQDSDGAIATKMEEIKAFMYDIKQLLAEKALIPHPYYPVAKQRYEYIGKCYESAVSISDYVLKSTKKQKYASVIQALAEAQALYWKMYILSVQAGQNKGWFSGWFGGADSEKRDSLV